MTLIYVNVVDARLIQVINNRIIAVTKKPYLFFIYYADGQSKVSKYIFNEKTRLKSTSDLTTFYNVDVWRDVSMSSSKVILKLRFRGRAISRSKRLESRNCPTIRNKCLDSNIRDVFEKLRPFDINKYMFVRKSFYWQF